MLRGLDAFTAGVWDAEFNRLVLAGRWADALKPLDSLVELRERKQGKDHWEAVNARLFRGLVERVAKEPEDVRKALTESKRQEVRASELAEQGKAVEAIAIREQVLSLERELFGDDHFDVARCYTELGSVQYDAGRLKEAEQSYAKALEIRRKALPPDHPDTAFSLNDLGVARGALGMFKEAEENHRQALEIYVKTLAPDDPDLATGYDNLGLVQQKQARFKEAEENHLKALKIRRESLPAGAPDLAVSHVNLGAVQADLNKLKEAEESFRQALQIRLKAPSPNFPGIANCHSHLGTVQYRAGKRKEAEESFRRSLEIRLKVLLPDHPDVAYSLNSLGAVQHDLGKVKEAEENHRRALEIQLRTLPHNHAEVAVTYNNLGSALISLGKLREAEECFKHALDIRRTVLGPNHLAVAETYQNLGAAEFNQGNLWPAEQHYRDALEITRKGVEGTHPRIAQILNSLGVIRLNLGMIKEAEDSHREALTIRMASLPAGHPDVGVTHYNLASLLMAQGKTREAAESARRAIDIFRQVFPTGHRYVVLSHSNLGAARSILGDFKEADVSYRSAAEAYELARIRAVPGGAERAAFTRELSPYQQWSVVQARMGQFREGWHAAETNLARALLDEIAVRNAPDGDATKERVARLEALDQLVVPLLLAKELSAEDQERMKTLVRERDDLTSALVKEAAERSRQEVYALEAIQKQVPADAAVVLWVDVARSGDPEDHGAWIVQSSGPPRWVSLPGTGEKGTWTDKDRRLSFNLRSLLDRGSPDWQVLARRLFDQRLTPLEDHLKAAGQLPAVQHLVVIPTGAMAQVPVELLTDRHRVSYAPSATVFAKIREQHRPLKGTSLLALGDPTFRPAKSKSPGLPSHGLLFTLVFPGGAAQAGKLQPGDVLLSYNGVKLDTFADLKLLPPGKDVPVQVWREGDVLDVTLPSGKLGVVFNQEPAPAAVRKFREAAEKVERTQGESARRLPASRIEVDRIAELFPAEGTVKLLGPDASERRLDELAAEKGGLKRFRVLHLATHGHADDASADLSHLLLAVDRSRELDGQRPQVRKVYNGRLTVGDIGTGWDLDADLVTLSACETALGPDGGGEGLLGFAQVLLRKGARGLVLSRWKVDDTATALLMGRFYENLLGKRDGLKQPMGRLESLREAQKWLRELPRPERDVLAEKLGKGVLRSDRGKVIKDGIPIENEEPQERGDRPYAHPKYWAAFILMGDPD